MTIPIPDRALFEEMTEAAKQATRVAHAAGHRLDSKVVKDSSWRAAQEVYMRHRPDEAPGARPIDMLAALPPEPLDDPVKDRMDI
jgi:myo-inositol catabolism protein IolC